jgi:hypothetical protein
MPSTIWRIAGLLAALQASFVSAEAAAEAVSKTITKDVVIVGGGASGAHAAVRLREDFGKSIVLIEKHDYLVRFCPLIGLSFPQSRREKRTEERKTGKTEHRAKRRGQPEIDSSFL